MKKRVSHKKFWSALALATLAFSGGALALPMGQSPMQALNNFKTMQQNPEGLINASNLALTDDFDYIKELNREFVKDDEIVSLFTEEDVNEAIKEGDYSSWKEAVESIDGFPQSIGVLPEEEFAILVHLRKHNFE